MEAPAPAHGRRAGVRAVGPSSNVQAFGNDAQMKACADACRSCADACRQMGAPH